MKMYSETARRVWPGQSLVEYIILFAAVIVLSLVFLGKDGIFGKGYKNMVERQGNYLQDKAEQVFH